jgi:hypothetical protein
MQKFGLDDAQQRKKIHGLWKIRFEANPDLRARFDQLVEARSRRKR